MSFVDGPVGSWRFSAGVMNTSRAPSSMLRLPLRDLVGVPVELLRQLRHGRRGSGKMKNLLLALFLIGFSLTNTPQCAFSQDSDRQYYAFDLMIDRSLAYASNIRYSYGDLGEHEKPMAKGNGVGMMLRREQMSVPDEFRVTWQTPDGLQHSAVVPVRSRINRSLEGATVLFVIFQDEVRGFISVHTPAGEARERFY